ncbi:hypothetical protein TNIN_144121 [Trichonephila inaurata madagascariensis]|uniref:Uncharacterized protein n=1 Tax=Trichonephila inaurata madagascariensis TaxID=2747483 RepID=A0A8X7BUA0_9ARAC|nr:hypothetical protein TNIN_144121 [Trichonephila inaurata madagascariensis]
MDPLPINSHHDGSDGQTFIDGIPNVLIETKIKLLDSQEKAISEEFEYDDTVLSKNEVSPIGCRKRSNKVYGYGHHGNVDLCQQHPYLLDASWLRFLCSPLYIPLKRFDDSPVIS